MSTMPLEGGERLHVTICTAGSDAQALAVQDKLNTVSPEELAEFIDRCREQLDTLADPELLAKRAERSGNSVGDEQRAIQLELITAFGPLVQNLLGQATLVISNRQESEIWLTMSRPLRREGGHLVPARSGHLLVVRGPCQLVREVLDQVAGGETVELLTGGTLVYWPGL